MAKKRIRVNISVDERVWREFRAAVGPMKASRMLEGLIERFLLTLELRKLRNIHKNFNTDE